MGLGRGFQVGILLCQLLGLASQPGQQRNIAQQVGGEGGLLLERTAAGRDSILIEQEVKLVRCVHDYIGGVDGITGNDSLEVNGPRRRSNPFCST